MRSIKCLPIAGVGTLMAFLMMPATQAQRNDVLIVPARARMIRLAFDVQALRGPTIVSYSDALDAQQPLVHVWNRSSKAWQQTTVETISRAPHVPANPNHVYVVGLPGEIPQALLAAFAHASDIRTLHTFSIADILTALDAEMQFTVPEWRALGKRYDLEVKEVQEERSRWGRFGPPRKYRQQPEPEQPAQPQIPPAPQPTVVEPTPPTPVDPPAPAPAPEEETVAEPLPDQQALFEYLLQYEPNDTMEPVPARRGTITMTPEKGIPTPPAVQDPAAQEEDFPEK